MKTSLKKLQKLVALRHDRRAQKQHRYVAQDELSRATQDMNDMRDCYDRLLSAAAATANSVYEFSESLKEMGDCLLEKTELNDDEESGKVLLMLGKVQFELQKLVDGYRSHIFRTITIPSESLLNELRIVEEMKKRCDGKRVIYEDLLKNQNEKGRLRNSKSECFPSPQLQKAHDEYDEEANVFVFRMKSLRRGQSRSFLTQASRHHAAQLYFFKKAVRSLEAIEPHVRLLTEQHHIDYQFSELKDDGHEISNDGSDGEDGSEDSSDTHDNGELSFDYGHNGPAQEVSTSKNSMEEKFPSRGFSFRRGDGAISKSEPLFPEKNFDSAERVTLLGPSPSRKFISYVLPTPDETRSQGSAKLSNDSHQTTRDQNKFEKLVTNRKFSGPIISDTQSVLKESNNAPKPSPLPPPISVTLSFKQLDPNVASHAKKAKRQAFSGPLTGKPWPINTNVTSNVSSAFSLPYSGSLLPRPTSTPKLSSRAFVTSPKINELHELPRPPAHIVSRRPTNRGAHSGPLLSKAHEVSTAKSTTASTLPAPPVPLSRSYSIPAGGHMEVALRVPSEVSQNLKVVGQHISSPPLTPVKSPNVHPERR